MFLRGRQMVAGLAVDIVGRDAEASGPGLVIGLEIDHGQGGVRAAVAGVQLDRLLKERQCLDQVRRRRALVTVPAAQERVIGLERRGLMLSQRTLLAGRQAQRHGIDHRARHPVLQREDVRERSVVAVRPLLVAAGCLDQLHVDADLIAGATHAALDHVADAEGARGLRNVDGAVAVAEGRVARDHRQAVDLRQVGHQVFGDAVGEIELLRIVAHVLERQHQDRSRRSVDRIARCRSREQPDRQRDGHGASRGRDLVRAAPAFAIHGGRRGRRLRRIGGGRDTPDRHANALEQALGLGLRLDAERPLQMIAAQLVLAQRL